MPRAPPPPRFHNVFNIQVHAVHFVLSFSQLKRNWRKTWDCSVKFGQIFVQKQWIIHLIQTKPSTAIESEPPKIHQSSLHTERRQTKKKSHTRRHTHTHTLSHTQHMYRGLVPLYPLWQPFILGLLTSPFAIYRGINRLLRSAELLGLESVFTEA